MPEFFLGCWRLNFHPTACDSGVRKIRSDGRFTRVEQTSEPNSAGSHRTDRKTDRKLLFDAKGKVNRLLDEFPAMLGLCTLVAPSRLPQHILSRPRIYRFVHVGDGNRTFGATTLSTPQSQPLAGNKHFGSIR